jgi:hypothetical protein
MWLLPRIICYRNRRDSCACTAESRDAQGHFDRDIVMYSICVCGPSWKFYPSLISLIPAWEVLSTKGLR